MTHNFSCQAGAEDLDLDPLGGTLLTPDEVASRLRVDKETLRGWRRRNSGPPVVTLAKSTRRYPENGLIIWLRDNTEIPQRARLAS
jgi:hypothetical protein